MGKKKRKAPDLGRDSLRARGPGREDAKPWVRARFFCLKGSRLWGSGFRVSSFLGFSRVQSLAEFLRVQSLVVFLCLLKRFQSLVGFCFF